MKKIDKVLLLDQSFAPVKVVNWQKALCLVFLEKAEVVSINENFSVRSATASHPVPSIIRLVNKAKIKPSKIRFSRLNIYKRDNFKCQYCGNFFNVKELTLDHVVPRSKGGKTSWINVTSSCYPCNSKKRDKTPQQANMRLLTQPKYPSYFSGASIIRFYLDEVPEDWKMWLGENV